MWLAVVWISRVCSVSSTSICQRPSRRADSVGDYQMIEFEFLHTAVNLHFMSDAFKLGLKRYIMMQP